ncbi:type II secretion system F family protein [Ilumatobacter sp.]|uniref:type II secretion system F family protein n=1 Tax=Ilumatobacter sp. TaxID=1967498 RepID=UPI003C37BE52
MSAGLLLLVLSSTLLLLAVVVVADAVRSDPDVEPDASAPAHGALVDSGRAVRALWAGACGVVVLAVSGWVVPALVIATAAWFWVAAFQRRGTGHTNDLERTEALASWIENLRDVLLAGDQPIGAIASTVPSAPPAIRPAVRRLSAALGHQDPGIAFRRFADELDDPLGDLVSAGLLIAVQRGARTVAVLTALATQARVAADRRRIVEAERAPIQREVLLLSLIMGALVMVLLVFGRAAYLDAYDTAEGQLFLGVVLGVYAILLLRVQRLSKFPTPSRFITGANGRNPAPATIGASR